MPECMEAHTGECKGEVQYHISPDREDMKAFPRCDYHFDRRLKEAEKNLELMSDVAPSWFDPAFVGERWEDDY